MILSRRSLITTGAAFLAAPAIVRASSLMVIKPERTIWRAGEYRWYREYGEPVYVYDSVVALELQGSNDGKTWVRVL